MLGRNGANYVLEIHPLDGPPTYEGTSAGDQFEFQRNGKTESLPAGRGQDTGMKWLLDKKHCLIIRTSEGFCRAAVESVLFLNYCDAGFSGVVRLNRRGLSVPLQYISRYGSFHSKRSAA